MKFEPLRSRENIVFIFLAFGSTAFCESDSTSINARQTAFVFNFENNVYFDVTIINLAVIY